MRAKIRRDLVQVMERFDGWKDQDKLKLLNSNIEYTENFVAKLEREFEYCKDVLKSLKSIKKKYEEKQNER